MDADAEDLKNMQECFRQMEEEDYKSFLEEAEVCARGNSIKNYASDSANIHVHLQNTAVRIIVNCINKF